MQIFVCIVAGIPVMRSQSHENRNPGTKTGIYYPSMNGWCFWSNFIATWHDLNPNWWFSKGNPLISEKSGWWNIIIWPDVDGFHVNGSWECKEASWMVSHDVDCQHMDETWTKMFDCHMKRLSTDLIRNCQPLVIDVTSHINRRIFLRDLRFLTRWCFDCFVKSSTFSRGKWSNFSRTCVSNGFFQTPTTRWVNHNQLYVESYDRRL